KACLDLQGAETQRTCSTEYCGENGEDINQLTEWTRRALFTDQRHEGRRQQLLTADAERGIGNGQADDGVNCPRVQSPVEHGCSHRSSHFIGLMSGHTIAVKRQ